MSKNRAIFFGTPQFALPSLEATFRSCELLALVCQPDKPRGRGQKLSPCETKSWALSHGLPTFSPRSLKKPSPELSEFLSFVDQTKPDVFVVVAYGNLLPQNILDLPKHGAINVHASLLPAWRGAAPIQRSIEAGDNQTGICIQRMVLELDAGNVFCSQSVKVPSHWQSPELSQNLSAMGASLLETLLSKPAQNWPAGTEQDTQKVSVAHKIQKSEGLWSPAWSSAVFHNKVRAFRGWPGVHAKLSTGERVKILKSLLRDSPTPHDLSASREPGFLTLSAKQSTLICSTVRTSEDSPQIELLELQIEGKSPMSAELFAQHLISRQVPLQLLKLEA